MAGGATFGGIIVALAAAGLGAGTIAIAINTRRRRSRLGSGYVSAGGAVYTGVQIGCGTVMILLGVLIAVLVVVR